MIRTALLVSILAAPVMAQTPAKQPPATKAPRAAVSPPTTKRAAPRPAGKTTLSGIYTREEADAGKETYLGLCAGCHQAVTHTGPEFRRKWAGKPLSELFTYMKTMMPKNDPGSLADEDYAILLAYMLQMNQMPPGKAYLSTDIKELAKIRIDTVRAVRKP
jgi:mono/diheme cytochrome c family protein